MVRNMNDIPTFSPIVQDSIINTNQPKGSHKKHFLIVGGVILLVVLLCGISALLIYKPAAPLVTPTNSTNVPQPKVPSVTFPQTILSASPSATPTSTLKPTPTSSATSPTPTSANNAITNPSGRSQVTVSSLLSSLPKATVPASDLSFALKDAGSPPWLLTLMGVLTPSMALANDSATLPVYAWNDPVFAALVKAMNNPSYGKQMALSLAVGYGLNESNFVSDEYQGVWYRATFTSNNKFGANTISYRLPGIEISDNGFSQHYQTTPFNVSHDQILLQAQTILANAKFSYSNLDWKHAYVWNLGTAGATNGYYAQVTIPTHLGSYRLLNDNSASDIVVTFDASDHFTISAANDTTYNTFASVGNYPIRSLDQAKQKLTTDGGFLNCADLESYLSGESDYGAHCDHVVLGSGDEFGIFNGTLSTVSITSTELVYIKVRNPLYPSDLTPTTQPAYYFIPAYRFAGTATAHFDLTKTILNSGNQPTNSYAVQRDGKKHIISLIVPAVDQF
jgi:type 1 fimbria pilin